MDDRIQYPEGQCVIVHDSTTQQLGEIVTNPFTGKQIIDMDSGVIRLDEDLPDDIYFVLIPAEEREAMWAILNGCYDEDKEIYTCDACGTKISKDQSHIWTEGLVICKYCPLSSLEK